MTGHLDILAGTVTKPRLCKRIQVSRSRMLQDLQPEVVQRHTGVLAEDVTESTRQGCACTYRCRGRGCDRT